MGKGDHAKVQAAMDTAVAIAVSEMNESESTAFLARVQDRVNRLISGDYGLDEDDQALLQEYHDKLVQICDEVSDFQTRFHHDPSQQEQ